MNPESWLAVVGDVVALSRGGKGTHAGGDQILRGDLRQAATRLVLPLWPFGQHARAANRGGGFVYDTDAYNDDLPYYVEVTGTQHLIVPYSLTYNDAGSSCPKVTVVPAISTIC